MGNDPRRGANSGSQPDLDDDEPIESTRAIQLDDFPPAPTAALDPSQLPGRGAGPVPRPMPRPMTPVGAPSQPLRPPQKLQTGPKLQAPIPPPPPDDDSEDQATRVFSVADAEAATRAIDTSAVANMRPNAKIVTPMELRTVSGPDRGKIHRIPEGKHLVGRGLDCNIVLADPAVSRKHFQIERKGDEAVLSDLGGANGTNINGVRKPKHVLESGDRVEIGTSVLEFFIEGAAPVARNRQAMPERQASATPQVQYERSRARRSLLIKVAGVMGFVAIGGGVGAYFATRKPGKAVKAAAPVAAVDDTAAEVATAIAKAKELLAETPPDFSNALDVLKAAKKKDPTNKELKALVASTRKEVDAEDTFEEAKQALKAGDFQGAINKFGEIDASSVIHADAQDELNAAKETLFSLRLAEAKKANEMGDPAAAIKALDAILALDPARAEAKAMRAQLAGDGDTKPGDSKGAKPGDAKSAEPKGAAKAADARPAHGHEGAKPEVAHAGEAKAPKGDGAAAGKNESAARPYHDIKVADEIAQDAKRAPAKGLPLDNFRADAAKSDGAKADGTRAETAKPDWGRTDGAKPDAGKVDPGKKADFSVGLAAYHNRLWTPAVQAFDGIAAGAFAKDQKAKAAAYSAAVRQVEASLNEAAASSSNAKKAIAAYKQAYNADQRVDGTHGSFIAAKLADLYANQAKLELQMKKFADAYEDAHEALNYVPDKAEAVAVVDKCTQQAATMLKDAKDLMDKKNYLGARDLARTVARILPASDKRAQEALDIAKKATDLSRQDAD